MKAPRDTLLNPLLSLVLGVAAGSLFSWLKTPLSCVIVLVTGTGAMFKFAHSIADGYRKL